VYVIYMCMCGVYVVCMCLGGMCCVWGYMWYAYVMCVYGFVHTYTRSDENTR